MAQSKVVMVRLVRQPHHDAVLRVRAAYRWLRRVAVQPPQRTTANSPVAQPDTPLQQEVKT